MCILFALLGATLIMAPSAAALANSVSASASDPVPGDASSLTIGWSGYQTATALKCISVQFSGGYLPASTLFNWDSSVQGWSDAVSESFVTSVNTATTHTGTGSLQLSRTWPASGYAWDAVGDGVQSLRDLSPGGDEFSAWVYLPAGAPGTNWQANLYLEDSSYSFQPSADFNLVAGQWTKVTYVPSSALLHNARQLIVGITENNADASVSVEVDDFQQGSSIGGAGGDIPPGMSIGSASLSGSFVGGTWTRDGSAAGTGTLVFNNASGSTPSGGSSSFTIGPITQPSATPGQTVYLSVTTYSGAGSGSSGTCTGSILDGPAATAYATESGIPVTAVMDPILTFSVAGYNAGTCNGVSITATSSTAALVPLRPTIATKPIGGQTLTVSSNAVNGYTVYARYVAAMSDGRGHSVLDWTGTNAAPTNFPAAGVSAFGYTTDHALSGTATRFQPNKWSGLSATNAEVIYQTGPAANDSGHVCYQAGVSSSTVAGNYSATVVYTAVAGY